MTHRSPSDVQLPTPRANQPAVAERALLRAVQRALQSSPHPPLRSVQCAWHEGVLILRGNVPTFFCKQLAQTVARSVSGIEAISNGIQVASQHDRKLPADER
jgi:osmotically-inducible protein OsmY